MNVKMFINNNDVLGELKRGIEVQNKHKSIFFLETSVSSQVLPGLLRMCMGHMKTCLSVVHLNVLCVIRFSGGNCCIRKRNIPQYR